MMIYSIISISLYMMVAMYMVSGQEHTSTMDTKGICDINGECKYMVEEMRNRWKKFWPLPRSYRTYIISKLLDRPRWPITVERGSLSRFKRGTSWTRL